MFILHSSIIAYNFKMTTAPMPERGDFAFEHDLKLTEVVRTENDPSFVAQFYDDWADTFENVSYSNSNKLKRNESFRSHLHR